jgi:hypothetical protein
MKNILKPALVVLLGSSSTALAAAGGAETGGLSWMVILFLVFGGLILVFQLVPGFMLFYSMLKGFFSASAKDTVAAVGGEVDRKS